MKKILLIFLLFPLLAFAQLPLEMDYPGDPGTNLPEYVIYIFNFVFGLLGIIIFVTLIYAGILYIFSTGDPGKTTEAKERIKASVMGFLLLTFSFLIFHTINPDLLKLNIILDPFKRTPLHYVDAPKIEDPDIITKENSLGKTLEYNLKKEGSNIQPLGKIEKLIEGIEEFLTKEIPVTPPTWFTLENDYFERLADLNKYLKNLTESCKASNLIAICTESESGSSPQGCQGDVCLLPRTACGDATTRGGTELRELD